MTHLGPNVRLEISPDTRRYQLRYLPLPTEGNLPPLGVHPLTAAILARLDEGWSAEDLETHLVSRLGGEPPAIREILADVKAIFQAHFSHFGRSSYVEVGDPEAIIDSLAASGDGSRLKARQVLCPNDRTPFPLTVEWVVTRYCNRRCIYCYQGAIPNGKPQDAELSAERMCGILREARRLGAYNYFITGGEPLLRADSYDILEYALGLGMKPDIISKQFIPAAAARRLAKAGLEHITLSVDSLEPSIAFQLTGIRNYAQRITDTIREMTSLGVRVDSKMVLTPLNLSSLEETILGLERLRVSSLAIEPYADNLQRHSESLRLERAQLRQAAAVVNRFRGRTNATLRIGFELDGESAAIETDEGPRAHHHHDHGPDAFVCHVSTTALLLLPDGRVGKCDKRLPGEDFILGDLRQQTVHEVWNSPRMLAALKPPRELYQGSLCFGCDDFEICHERARCYYDAYLTSGTLYGPGSNCPYLDADPRRVC